MYTLTNTTWMINENTCCSDEDFWTEQYVRCMKCGTEHTYTWEESCEEAQKLKKRFIVMHNEGQLSGW